MGISKQLFTEKLIQSFTYLEFEVYDFVRQNSSKIPYMTIRELANEAHVSTTTIISFCKKTGCSGFSEFKTRYKIWLEQRDRTFIEPLDVSVQGFFERAATSEYNQLLDQVAQVICEAKSIITIGMGNSGIMAKYACNYLSILGKFCSCIENISFDPRFVDLADCVMIVFSISGNVRNLLPLFEVSQNSKMKIISITNNNNNTMAKLSHYNIPYYVRYDTLPASMLHSDFTTQVPVIYIVESLAKRAYRLAMDQQE